MAIGYIEGDIFNVFFLIFRINVNLKRSVYCHAIANGDEEEWDFGWERYTKSEVASEKDMLLSALTCSKQPWLLIR